MLNFGLVCISPLTMHRYIYKFENNCIVLNVIHKAFNLILKELVLDQGGSPHLTSPHLTSSHPSSLSTFKIPSPVYPVFWYWLGFSPEFPPQCSSLFLNCSSSWYFWIPTFLLSSVHIKCYYSGSYHLSSALGQFITIDFLSVHHLWFPFWLSRECNYLI